MKISEEGDLVQSDRNKILKSNMLVIIMTDALIKPIPFGISSITNHIFINKDVVYIEIYMFLHRFQMVF